MVSNDVNWIRIFDITDISKHKKGFTIYKVVSMLYPEKCPDSITKITVWKRYNDFKKLHREIKSLHHSLKIKDKFPSLPSTSFFRRFDEEVIQHRKQMILNFMDYISTHSQLYTSNIFVKFFETSHTPSALLNSTINNIRSELNLPSEPEYLSFHSQDSDDECTMSDTDSISTMSSLSSFVQINDNDSTIRSTSSLMGLSRKLSSNSSLNISHTSKSSSSDTECNLSVLDVPDYLLQETSSIKHYSDFNYLEDADKYIVNAIQYENDKKYNEALSAYRNGIYLLLKCIKEERDCNRKQLIQFKVEKYLMSANKIYSLYLTSDKKEHQEFLMDPFENSFITDYATNLGSNNNRKNESISLGDFQILEGGNSSKKQMQYIAEAENYILLAAQLESDRKYADAFTAYKQGIFILLRHVKDDKDLDRKQIVRFKVEKYIIRADKIYNLHLCSDELKTSDVSEISMERPISDLYKYKVLKVTESGMMVLHSETQQLYYIKVIYKERMFEEDNLILPTKVPFMVQMHNFYNCENALFLILEYCSGSKLWDYANTSLTESDHQPSSAESKNIFEFSDNESECSFSELINEYNSNKIVLPDLSTNITKTYGAMNADEIVVKSQQLLTSVNETLRRNNESKKSLTEDIFKTDDDDDDDDFEIVDAPSQRKMSESSEFDSCDIEEFNGIPQESVVKWAAQLLLALEGLHSAGVICCDLDTKSILINDKGDLVLTYKCNVNRGKFFNYNSAASEVCGCNGISAASDWWSFGAIIYEMLVGMPLNYTHPEGMLNYTNLKIPKFVSVEARSLLKQLLTSDQKSRLGSGINGTEEIKSHPFFNTVRWQSLTS